MGLADRIKDKNKAKEDDKRRTENALFLDRINDQDKRYSASKVIVRG